MYRLAAGPAQVAAGDPDGELAGVREPAAELPDGLLSDFLDEAEASMQALEPAILKLESDAADLPALSAAFRLIHTLKGTGGFLGLHRLARIAHAAEEVLDRLRRLAGGPDGATEGAGALLVAFDAIAALLRQTRSAGREPPGGDDAVLSLLHAGPLHHRPPHDRPSSNRPSHDRPLTDPVGPRPAEPPEGAPATGRPPGTGRVTGRVIETVPMAMPAALPLPAPTPAPTPAHTRAAAPARSIGAHGAMPPEPGGDLADTGGIRVASPVLTRLLASVGELVLGRNQLLHLARQRCHDTELDLLAQRIADITAELQGAVLRTRMQPIGQAWAVLPRLVRDTAVKLGKLIAVETSGTDVELDRQVLDLIRDPLTHMVRNSCDHGIEVPADRIEARKPATGTIWLSARPDGGSVVITLRDDGRGIDPGRVAARAVAQGMATEAEVAAMSHAQMLALVFRPGLSTAAEVTAISGRGVGMDVVKTNVERMGGTVVIASNPGEGTTLTLTIPLTLAIVPALMVSAAGATCALPRGAVREIVRVRLPDVRMAGAQKDPVNKGGGQNDGGQNDGTDEPVILRIGEVPLLRLHGELLPLIDLAAVLTLPPEARHPVADATPPIAPVWHVAVIRTGPLAYGLIVDPVFDAQDIVVTPLCRLLRALHGRDGGVFNGTTILGDGRVCVVLDAAGLAAASGIPAGAAGHLPDAPVIGSVTSNAPVRLLLFTAAGQRMAVPLALIARLEHVDAACFAPSGTVPPDAYALRIGERLIAARSLRAALPTAGPVPTLIIDDGRGRRAALAIDRFEDVTEAVLRVEPAGVQPGVLGMALLDGEPTAILDTRHWLTRIDPGWFDTPDDASAPVTRLLVVEDSDFFRQMLVPVLTTAGYAVTSTASAAEALRLRDAGAAFDALITDIEMPEMDGLALARTLRSEGRWQSLPIVALTARTTPADLAAGQAAGFTDHVRKFDRAALLAALERCVRPALTHGLRHAA